VTVETKIFGPEMLPQKKVPKNGQMCLVWILLESVNH